MKIKMKKPKYLSKKIFVCITAASLALLTACGSGPQVSSSSGGAQSSVSQDISSESSQSVSSGKSSSSSGESRAESESSQPENISDTQPESSAPSAADGGQSVASEYVPVPSDTLFDINLENISEMSMEDTSSGEITSIADPAMRNEIVETINGFRYTGETGATGSGRIRLLITMSEAGESYDILINESGVEYNGSLFEGKYFSDEWIDFWLSQGI